MFNLEQAISEWRRQMRAAGIEAPELLDELESHLRDEVEHRMQAGANSEQAFQAALQSIGTARDLRVEFDKACPSARIRTRKALRLLFMSLPVLIGLILFGTWFIRQRQGQIDVTLFHVMLALGALVMMILVVPVGGYFARFLPATRSKKLLYLVTIGAPIAWAYVTQWFWGFLSFGEIVHLQLALLWTIAPWLAGGMLLSEWGLKCETLMKSHRQIHANPIA